MQKLSQKNYDDKVKNILPLLKEKILVKGIVFFKRKNCVVSHFLEMVDFIMFLFEKFHCNSSFSFHSLFA